MEKETLSSEVRLRVPRIIFNLIKAIIMLFIIEYVLPLFISPKIIIPLISIEINLLLRGASLIIIIYYGYSILRDIMILSEKSVSLIVKWFGIIEEETSLKRAAKDVIWIIAVLLSSAAILPLISGLPNIPPWFNILAGIFFFLLVFVFIYDFVKTIYGFSKKRIDKFTIMISSKVEKIEKEVEKKSKKEKKKSNKVD
jgi:hypothetical protein